VRVAALLGLLTVAFPAASFAHPTAERDRDRVTRERAPALAAAERAALDIAKVRVIGHEGLGVFVDVRFEGRMQRHLGAGGLEDAGVVLVLHRTAGSTSVVVTRGGSLDQRVSDRGLPDPVAAVRDRRMLRFLLAGASYSTVTRVEVLSVLRAPRTARAPIGRRPADSTEVELRARRTKPELFECSEIRTVYPGITRSIAAMDRYVEFLEAMARPPRRTHALARRMRSVGLVLGGGVELAYGEERC
jgi:hypothetical protein